eukprot:ANDGO_01874.mRNA.1 Transmembrane protein 56 homolog B
MHPMLLVWIVSFGFWYACQHLSQLVFAPFGFYRKFSKPKQIEWNAYAVSTVHAIVSVLLSCYALITEPSISGQITHKPPAIADVCLMITASYLAVDALVISTNLSAFSSVKATLIHHATAGLLFPFCTFGIQAAQFYGLVFTITEVSTPFVNLRWQLYTVGRDKTQLYLGNGVALVVVFFVVRIVMYPFIVYHLASNTPAIVHELGIGVALAYWLGTAVGGLLNHYWFYLLAKGLLKKIREAKKSRAQ